MCFVFNFRYTYEGRNVRAKDNSVVIDAGYHPQKCGDIELEGVISRSSAYTPVPGGVGPMTINTLIMQTLESCENHLKLD